MPRGDAGGGMATLKLRVSGMTCGHCQMKVEKALLGASGVYSAVVDLSGGEAEVDFNDDTTTTDQLIAAVAQAGDNAEGGGEGPSQTSAPPPGVPQPPLDRPTTIPRGPWPAAPLF